MGSDHTEDNSGGEGPKGMPQEKPLKELDLNYPFKKLVFFLMIALIDLYTKLLVKRKNLLTYEYL
jgi:hypothetical protein